MGVSLLIFFVLVNFTLGLVSVTLAHIAFCIGFVAIVVRARLAGMDESLTEAARDCGATPWEAFRYVTLPLIMPGVIAGALMAFTLSIDDFVITFFTAGAGTVTLPLQIYSMIKIAVTPGGQRGVDAVDAADAGAYHHRLAALAEPGRRPTGGTMKRVVLLLASLAFALSRRGGQGRVPPVQLEQLPGAGNGQALRGRLQVHGRADLLLGQRGAPREARRRRQGLRHVRAHVERRPGADQERAAEADRQGAAPEPQEHRPALPQHAVRSRQQVLGALRDVDDDHRLQRREDQGARAADRHVGGDLRSEVPREGQGPRHGARQRQRAFRRRAQVPGLLGQRRRPEALGRSRRA